MGDSGAVVSLVSGMDSSPAKVCVIVGREGSFEELCRRNTDWIGRVWRVSRHIEVISNVLNDKKVFTLYSNNITYSTVCSI